MTQQATQLTEDSVRELSRSLGEPEWLLARRVEAWRAFELMAMPSGLEEEWRRTDISGLDLEGALSRLQPARPDREEGTGAVALPVPSPEAGAQSRSGPQLVLRDLSRASRLHEEIVRENLHSIIAPTEWKLQALQAALWSGGTLIHVPRGLEVAVPVQLLVRGALPGAPYFPHLLVVAEEDSAVTIIQEAVSADSERQMLVSGAVEIVQRPNSRVRLFDIQRWGGSAYNFATVRARLEQGAQFLSCNVGLGGRLTRVRVEAILKGEGSQAELLGVTLGGANQHFDYQTLQDHQAPRTVSDLLFKAALTDSASEVWYGTVRIHKGASGSDANQTSRNLLLSAKAKAAPIPVLEIEQYDILRCSHGATAGPIDEEQLFYLESRGIDREAAEKLLVEAFFRQVLDRVPVESLRTSVEAALVEKLNM